MELEKSIHKKQIKEKIVILIPHLSAGGGEKVASYLTECLHKYFDLHLVLYEEKITFPYQGKLHLLGTTTLNIKSLKLSLKKACNFFIHYTSLKKLKKRIEPNCSISFFQGANLLNLLTKSNEKIICTVHTSLDKNKDFSGVYGLLHKIFVKFYYNKADFVVVPSYGLRDELIRLFNVNPAKIKVIYNPVDINKILKLSNENIEKFEEIFFSSNVIINVGRLTEAKGQKILIKIFKELKRKFKNLKLVFLGDGELRDLLFSFSENMGLKTFATWKKIPFDKDYDIYFLGFVFNPFPYIRKAKIFVLTSIWEGFANVIVESIALSTPIVATDCKHGPKEIIASDIGISMKIRKRKIGGYGILVPPPFQEHAYTSSFTKEDMMLLKAVEFLFTSNYHAKTYKIKGYKRALQFDIGKFCRKWIKILNDIIKT